MLTRGLGLLGVCVCVYGVGVYAWVVISGSEREREAPIMSRMRTRVW